VRLAVVSKFSPSVEGITEYARHVVRGLSARPETDQITVIANRTAADPASRRSDVEVRRVWSAGEVGLVMRILREVGRLKPDAVWYNVGLSMFGETIFSPSGFALPLITHRLGIRSIVTLHERRLDQLAELGVPDGLVRRAVLRASVRLLLLSDVVCVTTDQHRRELEQHRSPGHAQIVHLPLCGYDSPVLEPAGDPTTILMLTSHAPHKNLPTLIVAFRQLRRRLPAARLLVAGVDHPRFVGYLQSVKERYGAEPGIEWIGPVPEDSLRPLLRRATVVVVPYRVATGSSATVHQAASAGRPVIVSNLPEFRSMAEEEDLWLEFCRRGDPEHLTDALEALLTDPARRGAIARHNLESARKNSLAATTDRYVGLLQGPTASRSRTTVSGWPSGALSR